MSWFAYHYITDDERRFTWLTTDEDPGQSPGEGWFLSHTSGPFDTYDEANNAKMNHLRGYPLPQP